MDLVISCFYLSSRYCVARAWYNNKESYTDSTSPETLTEVKVVNPVKVILQLSRLLCPSTKILDLHVFNATKAMGLIHFRIW